MTESYDEPLDPADVDPSDEAFVQSLLGQPAPMPSDVWLRLERALMEESAHREAGRDAGSVQAPRQQRSRRRTGAMFGLAAAAVLVVGGTVVSTLDLRGGGQGPAPLAASASSGIVLASGTDYEPETLAQQVKRTFSSWKAKLKSATNASVEPIPSGVQAAMGDMPHMADMPFMHDVDNFQGCMHKITQLQTPEDVAVLLVDLATMQGMVTAVVVVPAEAMPGADPAMEQVFVVTPTCSVKARTEVDLDAS